MTVFIAQFMGILFSLSNGQSATFLISSRLFETPFSYPRSVFRLHSRRARSCVPALTNYVALPLL